MEKMAMFFLMATLSVMSGIVHCSDHSKSVSPELGEQGHDANLLRILEEPQQEDSNKRAIGMLRMGRSLPYYTDDDAGMKRAVSYLRMGRSGLNDKKAVNMLRMGKRVVSLLRMGRSSSANNNQLDEQYDEEANSPSRKFFYDSPNYFVDDAEKENYKLAHDNKRAVSMLRMG
ncbi:hypothetical protein HELRODRAFT_167674 [Helobdella robusta]|uniref:Uncharacterized protein n=1 Tax=Helobdella robusta TaxID=6412 RepID=T1EZN5_HELRO|nr:hypothetical protein HELRODRAFT_167674 [Helobdella robusta]ESO09855.1 hypothetical protein HELRODRAFT_167674 [Helobdella robusta]